MQLVELDPFGCRIDLGERERARADKTRAKCKGYYSGDIARLVAAELVTEGIKVWR